jgi:uncharacterized phiE125 gp8 family phage protein
VTVAIVAVDRDALPAALLPLAKAQLRVDWSGEDAFITSVLARAIARFEQVNEVTINPTTVAWTVDSSAFSTLNGGPGATLPVRPVSAFTAQGGEPPADVSGDYAISLKWDSIHGCPIQKLTGAAADLGVELTAGYTGLATLPPPLIDVVLRHTAHLYEHREILLPGRDYVAPDLKLDATWWMPRV